MVQRSAQRIWVQTLSGIPGEHLIRTFTPLKGDFYPILSLVHLSTAITKYIAKSLIDDGLKI